MSLSILTRRAGPLPVLGMLNQACRHGIILDVVNDSLELSQITYPVIKRFVLPEGLSYPTQVLIGAPSRIAFQEFSNPPKRLLRLDQQMNVIGHHHKR